MNVGQNQHGTRLDERTLSSLLTGILSLSCVLVLAYILYCMHVPFTRGIVAVTYVSELFLSPVLTYVFIRAGIMHRNRRYIVFSVVTFSVFAILCVLPIVALWYTHLLDSWHLRNPFMSAD